MVRVCCRCSVLLFACCSLMLLDATCWYPCSWFVMCRLVFNVVVVWSCCELLHAVGVCCYCCSLSLLLGVSVCRALFDCCCFLLLLVMRRSVLCLLRLVFIVVCCCVL